MTVNSQAGPSKSRNLEEEREFLARLASAKSVELTFDGKTCLGQIQRLLGSADGTLANVRIMGEKPVYHTVSVKELREVQEVQ